MKPAHRWLAAAALVAGFLGGLAALQDRLQRQRVATCRRALPAVAPQPGIRLLRAAPGSAPDTVRVDYVEGHHQHWLTCRFDADATLTALTTEGTSLTGASLYMLRRFYLDTPDAERADPALR